MYLIKVLNLIPKKSYKNMLDSIILHILLKNFTKLNLTKENQNPLKTLKINLATLNINPPKNHSFHKAKTGT